MASLHKSFKKSLGAWTAAKPYKDGSGVYLQNGKWEEPNTNEPLSQGTAVFFARFGPGQIHGVGQGGIYAVDPPAIL